MSSAPQKLDATFHVQQWNIEQSTTRGVSLGTANAVLVFDTPDIKGTATGTYVLHYNPERASQPDQFSFDGQLLFQGSIAGKKGDVVIRERGHAHGELIRGTWDLSTHSASGELRGIIGSGDYTMKHATYGDVQSELTVIF